MGYREWRAGYGSGFRLAPALGLVAVIALGLVIVYSLRADDEPARLQPPPLELALPGTSGVPDTRFATTGDPSSSRNDSDGVVAAGSSGSTGDTVTTGAAAPSSAPSTTVTPRPSTTQPATTIAAPTTTAPPVTTTTRPPPATTTTTAAAARLSPASATEGSFVALPDGSPLPVIAIFDVDEIKLSGFVPTPADVERLTALAIANSKTPATVVNELTINPAVPRNVGVRVIELTSSRFPPGSAEVVPVYAAELDRVANVMNALPHVTVTVVGHADQRGDELRNYELSDQRARSVVNYLVSKGIAASRLASRAVGEDDLLTLSDDPAGLALNRRTEFIFYGLLQE